MRSHSLRGMHGSAGVFLRTTALLRMVLGLGDNLCSHVGGGSNISYSNCFHHDGAKQPVGAEWWFQSCCRLICSEIKDASTWVTIQLKKKIMIGMHRNQRREHVKF